jgi:predicted NAD/FAD-binding protein
MATVCLNKSMPTVKSCLPVFQTWHPTQEIQAQEILASVQFDRPVMNFHSLAQVEQIKQTMEEKNNRIWFSGSYLGGGIPLLEAGVRSSLYIANKLGVPSPW